jgi:hypothetical protein
MLAECATSNIVIETRAALIPTSAGAPVAA